jgi:enoyl-CoA hydratase/carnithine racemase
MRVAGAAFCIRPRALMPRNLSSPAADNEPRVLVQTDKAGVCTVTLNRPSKLNALDMGMFTAIGETAAKLKTDKNIRVIILNGAGRAFCSGLDIGSVASNPSNFEKLLKKPAGTAITNLAQDVAYLWREIPVPVIAVLHGVCFGGGLQIALGADIRLSTADCKLSVMEAKYGLIPDMSARYTWSCNMNRIHIEIQAPLHILTELSCIAAASRCGSWYALTSPKSSPSPAA